MFSRCFVIPVHANIHPITVDIGIFRKEHPAEGDAAQRISFPGPYPLHRVPDLMSSSCPYLKYKLHRCSTLTVSQEELIFLQMGRGKMRRAGRMEKAVNAVHWQFEKSDGVPVPLYRTRVKAYRASLA